MKNPITLLLAIRRKLLVSDKKTAKGTRRFLIEKKWWMGEDLFIDQKPFINNTLKDKHLSS